MFSYYSHYLNTLLSACTQQVHQASLIHLTARFLTHSSFYLLCDVLDSTGLSEADFLLQYPSVEIVKISKSDLMKATLSLLDQRVDNAEHDQHLLLAEDEVSIVHRNEEVDAILRITTITL